MLSKKERRQALAEMTYEELFDAVLCREREKYINAPASVREAVYQAWLAQNDDMGLIDIEVLDSIERRLGIDKEYWEAPRIRLFVDMDGTLAEFKPCRTMETLYERGYFANLKPQENVVEAVRIHASEPYFEVYTLSAYLADSPYVIQEKEAWLDQHLPEIDAQHRIFCECGQDKSLYIPGGINQADCLLDDYTINLQKWQKAGGKGIKIMNGINGKKGTWQGARVYADREPEGLAIDIEKFMIMNQDKTRGQYLLQDRRR